MIGSTIYIPRKIKDKLFEIASFVDGSKDSISVYKVKIGQKNIFHCDCPGYWRQKVKEEHKHCRIINFWVEKLENKEGYCFWFDNEDNIEFHKFIENRIEKYVLENS